MWSSVYNEHQITKKRSRKCSCKKPLLLQLSCAESVESNPRLPRILLYLLCMENLIHHDVSCSLLCSILCRSFDRLSLLFNNCSTEWSRNTRLWGTLGIIKMRPSWLQKKTSKSPFHKQSKLHQKISSFFCFPVFLWKAVLNLPTWVVRNFIKFLI